MYIADAKIIKIRNIETNIIFIWRNDNIFQFHLSIFQQNMSSVFFTINEGIIFFLPDQNKKEAQILGQG